MSRAIASLTAVLCALSAPAAALYRLDTFAGQGYGDGGPARAASVVGPADAVTDAAGNVYFSERGNQLVRRVDAATGTITTVAGNGSPGSAGDGGPAILANLHDPDGIALDPTEQHHLYVVDNGGARVQRVDLATGTIMTFAGTGTEAGSIDGEGGDASDDVGDGRPATQAALNEPVGVAVDAAGNVYISERDENHPDGVTHRPRIRVVDHVTGIIRLFAGGLPEGFNGDGQTALATAFADPIGLQFDGAGNLYVGELGNSRIRKIAADGTHVVTTIAGNGMFPEPNDSTLVPFNEGGPATAASLHRPVRFALVPRGCGGASGPPCEVYLGDSGHHCVRKIDVAGNIQTVVNAPPAADTAPTPGNSGDGGPAVDARLMTPAALLGPNNTVLVVDDAASRVRLFDPATGMIRAFAGTVEGGFGGDGGPAVRALLNRPTGVAVDASGGVLISEHDNHRIRRVAPDEARTITTFAGTGGRGADGDGGQALEATFDQPTGITLTPTGDVLVADARTDTVRRIDPSGVISPFAGQAYAAGFGGDGGPATAALLDTPLRMAVTAAGVVLIADFNNDRIRAVAPDETITTFAAGFHNPAGLALGADGSLYVADFGNKRIVVVDPAGGMHTLAGTGVATGSLDGEGGNPADDRGDGGPAGAATFSDPTGVSVASDGTLLVADQGNNVIRRIALDAEGKLSPASIVTTIIGDGRPTFGGDGGNAVAASVNRPTEAVALPDGRILVADRGNQRVRIATPVTSLCDVSCDDGDPCTRDSCDPVRGCEHAPTSDSDGDGICDAADDCPTVPDPAQDGTACAAPAPGGPGGPGGPAGSPCEAGAASCIPGSGKRGTECLAETMVRGADGSPVVRCTDGNAACDEDDAPGGCAFTIAWCFNATDPRVTCAATGVRRVRIRATMAGQRAARAVVATVLGTVAQMGGTPHGASILFAPPLAEANQCTDAVTVPVRLRGRPGHLRSGKALVVLTATGSRVRSVDRVRLVCVPGA